MGISKPQNFFGSIRSLEERYAAMRTSRTYWRTAACVAIFLLCFLAMLACPSCAPVSSSPNSVTPPAPTPHVAPLPFIRMQAIQWQWNFYLDGVPQQPGNEITLHKGALYYIQVVDADDPDQVDQRHGCSTILGIGLKGGLLSPGQSLPLQTIRPEIVGDYPFNCNNPCGVGHEGMTGVFHVVE